MSKLLKNVLFSITVNQGTDQKATATAVDQKEEEDQISYNDLKRMIEEMGGKVCATVHKKVDYLIASSCAVESATQRVRKADKFKVPVLKMQYIRDVYTKVIQPDAVQTYVYASGDIHKGIQAYQETSAAVADCTPASTSAKNSEKNTTDEDKKKKKRKLDDTDPSPSVSSYKTPSFVSSEVFECSCICHDRGETSCSWCVTAHTSADAGATAVVDTSDKSEDIVVNKRQKVKKSSNKKKQ